MGIIAIASHESVDGTRVGLRLMDINSGIIKDYTLSEIKGLIDKGELVIDNIELSGASLKGVGHSVNRLTQLNNNQRIHVNYKLIVLGAVGDIGYVVTDYSGYIRVLSKLETYYQIKNFGAVNSRTLKSTNDISGRHKKYGTTQAIIDDIKKREIKLLNINRKLDLLGQPYSITPDYSIEINNKGISSLVIAGPVERLHEDVFYGCNNLNYIRLPRTLKEFGLRSLETIWRSTLIQAYKGTHIVKNTNRSHIIRSTNIEIVE